MKRRTLLPGLAAMPLGLAGLATIGPRSSAAMDLEEARRQSAERQARAIAALPYERIEVDGRDSLAVVEELRMNGLGWPIVIGGDDELAEIAERSSSDGRSPADILATAANLVHHRDLPAYRAEGGILIKDWIAELQAQGLLNEGRSSEINDPLRNLHLQEFLDNWALLPYEPPSPDPTDSPSLYGLTVAHDLKRRLLAKVRILLIPTAEGACVPAYLRWGGWDENPPPEYHVAALRSWRERYGAELVGLSGDTMNLRVSRRPATREEALGLAQEHCDYCPDLLNETGTPDPLADELMASEWWYFWWD